MGRWGGNEKRLRLRLRGNEKERGANEQKEMRSLLTISTISAFPECAAWTSAVHPLSSLHSRSFEARSAAETSAAPPPPMNARRANSNVCSSAAASPDFAAERMRSGVERAPPMIE